MKKLSTLLVSILIASVSFATQWGPDVYGYTAKDTYDPNGPTYSWIDILPLDPTEVKLLADDNNAGPYQMNFDFRFYWYDVNQFWVGSNGYLLFENGQLAANFNPFPQPSLPNNVIAPFLADLNFASTNDSAECWYWISADLDTLIVSWINVPFWDNNFSGGLGNNSFQLILSTVDSSITYQYRDQAGISNYEQATVGFENNTGQLGLNIFYHYNPPPGYAIKIYYPANPTLQVFDAGTIYNSNPESGGIFLSQNGDNYALTTLVKNVGNQLLPPFNVNGQLLDPFSTALVNDIVLTDTLDPAETQLITFPTPFTPSALGTYRFITTTQNSGDYTALNDMKTQELVVVDTTQPLTRLGFDDNQTGLLGGLSWIGGEGGAGVYFIPPYYPCKVQKVHFYILSNGNNVGFSTRIFDDDGVNGLPYTLFDSIYVPNTAITTGTWTNVQVLSSSNVIIPDGGFYVSWDMQGENINLATSLLAPFSNRTFEVFESAFAIFRFRDTQELMINASIEPYSFPTGENGLPVAPVQFELFPNPANSEFTLLFEVTNSNDDVLLSLFDVQGKQVQHFNIGKQQNGVQTFKSDIHDLIPGLYMAELTCGGDRKMEKLVVAH